MENRQYDDPLTVTELLSAAGKRAGDLTAIHYEDREISFCALEAESRRAAAGLAALGVEAGDWVAFWLPNTPAYLALYFGCARLGAIAVAVNTRFRAGEVEDLLGRTAAKILVMWPGFRGIDFPGLLEGVDRAALSALEKIVIYDESGTEPEMLASDKPTVAYQDLLGHGEVAEDRARHDIAVNSFSTSGTTKAPKFVLHSHASMAGHAAEVVRDFDLAGPDKVMLMELPLCGVFGMTGALSALAAARPMVLTSAFEAERSVDLLRHHGITHFDASDEMIDRMFQVTDDDAPFAKVGFTGYAIFNSYLDDIVERADARGLKLIGLWGMSEMQALVTRREVDDPIPIRKKGGGRPVSPRATARVRDPETGILCKEGEAGEIEFQGPSMMMGYYQNPEATAEAMTEDGYIRTGDLGRMEPGGSFEYLTRMGDVLRLGGFLVSPAEIEAEVQSHPSVAAVQVVSAPIEGADRAVAFVVPDSAAAFDPEAVKMQCAARLARYKVPAHVVALDAFPVTESANGVKIQRTKLREMASVLGRKDGRAAE